MRIHVLRNEGAATRVVLVPVRAYPNAVTRNRARRLVRECWRTRKGSIRPGYDVAVVMYPGSDSFDDRMGQLERLLGQAGLVRA